MAAWCSACFPADSEPIPNRTKSPTSLSATNTESSAFGRFFHAPRMGFVKRAERYGESRKITCIAREVYS